MSSQIAAKIEALGPEPHELHAEDVADAVLNIVEGHLETQWTQEQSIALIPPAAKKLFYNLARTNIITGSTPRCVPSKRPSLVRTARFIDLIAESWQANTDLIADIVESSIAHGFDVSSSNFRDV